MGAANLFGGLIQGIGQGFAQASLQERERERRSEEKFRTNAMDYFMRLAPTAPQAAMRAMLAISQTKGLKPAQKIFLENIGEFPTGEELETAELAKRQRTRRAFAEIDVDVQRQANFPQFEAFSMSPVGEVAREKAPGLMAAFETESMAGRSVAPIVGQISSRLGIGKPTGRPMTATRRDPERTFGTEYTVFAIDSQTGETLFPIEAGKSPLARAPIDELSFQIAQGRLEAMQRAALQAGQRNLADATSGVTTAIQRFTTAVGRTDPGVRPEQAEAVKQAATQEFNFRIKSIQQRFPEEFKKLIPILEEAGFPVERGSGQAEFFGGPIPQIR